MEKEGETAVVFRVWKEKDGGVLALFPYLQSSCDPAVQYCLSFEHVGQHCGADYAGCIARTRPAKPREYAALKHELESAPYSYRLKVIQRRNHAPVET